MTTEPNDSIQQSLIDMRTAMLERQALKSLKKLKTGRAVTFVAALFYATPFFLHNGALFYQGTLACLQGETVLVFFILFFISRYRPFISLLLSALLLTGVSCWLVVGTILYGNNNPLFELAPSMLSMQLFIGVMLRLIGIFYVLNAAFHSRRFERLTAELDNLEVA